MSDWYYSTDGRQRQGPVPVQQLREMIASYRLPAATLFWREGLDRWHRLDELNDEPGLQLQPALASLPAQHPPPVPQAAPAPAAGVPAAASGTRNRGCLIAILAGAACMVPMLGILAAIAVPAYQTYLKRAGASEVLSVLEPLKHDIAAHRARHGQCPDNRDLAAPLQRAQTSARISHIQLLTAINGHCGLAAQLQGLQREDSTHPATLWLEQDLDNDAWICRSTLDDRQLPAQCRR